MRKLRYEDVYSDWSEDDDVPLAHLMKKSEDSNELICEHLQDAVPFVGDDDVPLAHRMKKSEDSKEIIGEHYQDAVPCQGDDDVPLAPVREKSEFSNKIFSEPLPDATPLQPKTNDFVVVKFTNKKFISHFVGVVQITHMDEYPDDLLIRFLKKQTKKPGIFVFPMRDDISLVNKSDIVSVLPAPLVDEQEQYRFCTSLSMFKNLG